MQVRNDVPALQAALRHPDPEIRRKAAVALRALDVPAALPALADALAIEADAPARASLLAAVQHFTPPDKLLPLLISQHNVEALIDLLYAGPAPAMHAVIEALVRLGDRSAVEALIIVFHAADQVPDDVRYAAANALIALQSAPAIVTPLAALRRDQSAMRRMAALILGQTHATWAVPGLVDALADPDAEVRAAVREALTLIGTPAAHAALADAPADDLPVDETPANEALINEAPADEAPAEETNSAEETLAEEETAEDPPAAETLPAAITPDTDEADEAAAPDEPAEIPAPPADPSAALGGTEPPPAKDDTTLAETAVTPDDATTEVEPVSLDVPAMLDLAAAVPSEEDAAPVEDTAPDEPAVLDPATTAEQPTQADFGYTRAWDTDWENTDEDDFYPDVDVVF
jgi:HEAT repeat protein